MLLGVTLFKIINALMDFGNPDNAAHFNITSLILAATVVCVANISSLFENLKLSGNLS